MAGAAAYGLLLQDAKVTRQAGVRGIVGLTARNTVLGVRASPSPKFCSPLEGAEACVRGTRAPIPSF
jgi:hypothetical protein